MIEFSIAIVSYHSTQDIIELLESARSEFKSNRAEVIVIDNSEEYDTILKKFLASYSVCETKYIHNSQNTYYSLSNNQAAQLARGEYFLVLNPDIRFNKEIKVLRLIGSLLAKERDVVIAAPAVITNGELYNIRLPETPLNILKHLMPWNFIFPSNGKRNHYNKKELNKNHFFSGCFLAFRRKEFLAHGGFDQNLKMYYSDADICNRFQRTGRLIFLKDIRVVHLGSTSTISLDKKLRNWFALQIVSSRDCYQYIKKCKKSFLIRIMLIFALFLNGFTAFGVFFLRKLKHINYE